MAVAVLLAAGCEDGTVEAGPSPSPTPRPSVSLRHPVQNFDLTEEDALTYLGSIDERLQQALHEGSLGPLHDATTRDGDARRVAADTIVRDFRNGWVNRTTIEVERTEIVSLEQHLAVFEQTRLVRPCVYDLNSLQVVGDDRVVRETVRRYMAEEDIDWRLDHEEVLRSSPTDERTDCPPS